MEREKILESIEDTVYEELEKLAKKAELNPAEIKAATDAVCLLEKMQKLQNGEGSGGYSESYSNGGSYRRGRNSINGRFMSMNSRHSVTDRAIAELEKMDTYSDYERQILSDLIRKIESN